MKNHPLNLWRVIAALGLPLFLSPAPATAATVTVQIINFSFSPANVTIDAGDTVTWVQRDTTQHNSASDSGVWTGPLLNRGQTFSFTFNTSGSFPYHCDPHPFMQGVVTVRAAANTPPTVSITSPPNGALFTAPANITLEASASDANGSVTQVEFFVNGTSVGIDATAPYAATAGPLAAGTYSLTALATDNQGAATTSAAISITVNPPANTPPSVAVTQPSDGASFTAPATLNIEATASDADGTVAQVEFFVNGISVGIDSTAPYAATAGPLAAGSYSLTAKATDNQGAATTSAAITIMVNPPANTPPSVAVTQPSDGASFTAPATLNIEATASDADGSVAQVEFFVNGTSVGIDTTAPYAATAGPLAAGSYSLTARATDNQGAAATSTPVTVTVTEGPAEPVIITLIERLEGGQIRLTITGIPAGKTYVVEGSADLAAWSQLHTASGPGGPVIFTDTGAPSVSIRFYRVALP